MARLPARAGLVRGGLARVCLVLCAALALALCKPAAAQSIERIDMPEGSIRLIVPAGQCAIERDTEDGRRMYALAQRMQTTKILLLYAGCGDPRRIAGVRSGFDLKEYGVYSVPQQNGVPFKESKSATREELIDGYAKVFPPLDGAVIARLAQPRAQAEGAAPGKLAIGTLERDANALYLGVSADAGAAQGAGPAPRKWSVAALTLIKGYMISHTLSGEPAQGAPFAAMLARQENVAALLVEANR
ncbi:MAG: hypothetical protein JWN73_3343 [Betaproteobacteria bacterium]|nr:hypothetical protein [Betaproteobacteria bacterium]